MASQPSFQGRWFSIVTTAAGDEVVQAADEALIVPLTAEGEVLLALEPSAAFNEPTLIVPGGIVEAKEPPAEAANRELQEEIGYKAGRLDCYLEVKSSVKTSKRPYATVPRSFCLFSRRVQTKNAGRIRS